ncbi:hypothetical protein F4604DRAFT_725814 [Suillus subluteus]|nr:hypothetical protein F4604DRAFT_725814 [Suillus subluteus]
MLCSERSNLSLIYRVARIAHIRFFFLTLGLSLAVTVQGYSENYERYFSRMHNGSIRFAFCIEFFQVGVAHLPYRKTRQFRFYSLE